MRVKSLILIALASVIFVVLAGSSAGFAQDCSLICPSTGSCGTAGACGGALDIGSVILGTGVHDEIAASIAGSDLPLLPCGLYWPCKAVHEDGISDLAVVSGFKDLAGFDCNGISTGLNGACPIVDDGDCDTCGADAGCCGCIVEPACDVSIREPVCNVIVPTATCTGVINEPSCNTCIVEPSCDFDVSCGCDAVDDCGVDTCGLFDGFNFGFPCLNDC